MRPPIVALLTDFGTRDHYVGTMKGVILGICPGATLVDLSHEIDPQDVAGAALELAAACRFFAPGTIFLTVVDPGVGSSRRAVAAASGGFRFVAPDNGVLSAAFDAAPPERIVELTNPRYAAPVVSRTFEGRDRFAPAAGWLAAGVDLAELGSPVDGIARLDLPRPRATAEGVEGEVVRVDRFGNLITNIDGPMLAALAPAGGMIVEVAGHRVPGMVGTYAEAGAGAVCALVGSSGTLEVAVNRGSAAAVFGVGRGAAVRVRMKP